MSGVKVENLSPEDLKNLPQNVRDKMSLKGSFQKVDAVKQESRGIGAKAVENKPLKKKTVKKSEKKSDEKVETVAEKRDRFIKLALELYPESKIKRLSNLLAEPEDACGQLGISFTEDELDTLIYFKGVSKEIDVLKNGKLKVVFKSLTKGDRDQVIRKYSEAIKNDDPQVYTKEGGEQYKAKILLALSIEKLGDDDAHPDLDKRIEYLGSLSDMAYEHLVRAFNLFLYAVNEAITEETIKNV